jgi:hypothetical protein
MNRDDARLLAETFVDERLGGMPDDATLERISEINARSGEAEDEENITTGFIVRFGRQLNGVPLRGNLVADHITVLIGAEGVVAWTRYWPELGVEEGENRRDWPTDLLSVGEAVSLAADGIARSVKGELRLVSARQVYGTRGPSAGSLPLVPAYELQGDDGTRIVVDALTGRVMR